MTVNTSGWAFYERQFSESRLRHYVLACGGDRAQAMTLYEWNAEVSAAFWESLAYLEVALRNTIDARMSVIHAGKGRSGHWIFDDSRELGRDGRGPHRHKYPYEDVATAIRRVRNNRQILDPGQIISEISFGFWHQMVSSRQRFLWPDLAGAFPNAPDRRQATVHDPIAALRDFRNRIGHHHRIWSRDIPARYAELLALAGYIDGELPGWIHSRSRVPSVLAARPL